MKTRQQYLKELAEKRTTAQGISLDIQGKIATAAAQDSATVHSLIRAVNEIIFKGDCPPLTAKVVNGVSRSTVGLSLKASNDWLNGDARAIQLIVDGGSLPAGPNTAFVTLLARWMLYAMDESMGLKLTSNRRRYHNAAWEKRIEGYGLQAINKGNGKGEFAIPAAMAAAVLKKADAKAFALAAVTKAKAVDDPDSGKKDATTKGNKVYRFAGGGVEIAVTVTAEKNREFNPDTAVFFYGQGKDRKRLEWVNRPKATAKEQPAKEQPAKEQPAKKQPAKEQPAKEQPAKEQPAA